MWPWRRRPPPVAAARTKITWYSGPVSAGEDAYHVEPCLDGRERVVAGARRSGADLLLALLGAWRVSGYWLLYVLTTSRTDTRVGRYQAAEPVDRRGLEEFLRRYEPFLCHDGRHSLWVASVEDDPRRQLVYDQHDILYLYGDPEGDLATLQWWGFRPGVVDIGRVHAHHYHPEHDAFERALLKDRAWTWSPLQREDDPGRTDDEGV